MWVLKNDGNFAENPETGQILKMDLGKDKIIRVKKNYKTIGTFKKIDDAKNFIADFVEKNN